MPFVISYILHVTLMKENIIKRRNDSFKLIFFLCKCQKERISWRKYLLVLSRIGPPGPAQLTPLHVSGGSKWHFINHSYSVYYQRVLFPVFLVCPCTCFLNLRSVEVRCSQSSTVSYAVRPIHSLSPFLPRHWATCSWELPLPVLLKLDLLMYKSICNMSYWLFNKSDSAVLNFFFSLTLWISLKFESVSY